MQLPAATALALGLAFAVPAHADTLAEVQEAGKLVVATEMQFPPFDFMVNGEYTGVDKDLLDEVGKELGVEMEYVDLPWTSVLPGLEAGKYDFVGAPLNASQARLERYAFSSPIAYSGNAFVKRKGNDEITGPESLAGKTVGVIKASSTLKQVTAYSETLPEPIEVREYSDMLGVYADVANGRIDAGASSVPNVSYASVQRPDQLEVVQPPFGQPNYYGWVTRKDPADASLIEAISAALEAMKEDGRMAEIQMKWFGQTEDLPDTMPDPGF